MRRLLLSALLAAVPLVVTAAPAWPAELNFACYSPPQNPTPVPCHTWHTQPVLLAWSYDTAHAEAIDGDCTPQVIRNDTPGTVVRCTIQDTIDTSTTGKTATVRLDATAPTVTMAPARPPDHGGWWNQPVTFGFLGSDATSGVASCDSVTYAGPDSAAAQITGGCRDVAGNAAVRSIAVGYDATPPAVTSVRQLPGNRAVRLSWKPSADAVRTEIVRVAGTSGRATSVYSGTRDTFTDRSLRNGVRYRYSITVYDGAGNAASRTVSSTPFSLSPVQGARLSAPPLLRWHPVRHAQYYNVQLFRGRRKILSAWPTATRLQLRREWRFGGERLRLVAGRYRWYVWPGYGSRAAERYGRLIGHSTFTIIGRHERERA